MPGSHAFYVAIWFLEEFHAELCLSPRRLRIHSHSLDPRAFQQDAILLWSDKVVGNLPLRFVQVVNPLPDASRATVAHYIIVQGYHDRRLSLLMHSDHFYGPGKLRDILAFDDANANQLVRAAQLTHSTNLAGTTCKVTGPRPSQMVYSQFQRVPLVDGCVIDGQLLVDPHPAQDSDTESEGSDGSDTEADADNTTMPATSQSPTSVTTSEDSVPEAPYGFSQAPGDHLPHLLDEAPVTPGHSPLLWDEVPLSFLVDDVLAGSEFEEFRIALQQAYGYCGSSDRSSCIRQSKWTASHSHVCALDPNSQHERQESDDFMLMQRNRSRSRDAPLPRPVTDDDDEPRESPEEEDGGESDHTASSTHQHRWQIVYVDMDADPVEVTAPASGPSLAEAERACAFAPGSITDLHPVQTLIQEGRDWIIIAELQDDHVSADTEAIVLFDALFKDHLTPATRSHPQLFHSVAILRSILTYQLVISLFNLDELDRSHSAHFALYLNGVRWNPTDRAPGRLRHGDFLELIVAPCSDAPHREAVVNWVTAQGLTPQHLSHPPCRLPLMLTQQHPPTRLAKPWLLMLVFLALPVSLSTAGTSRTHVNQHAGIAGYWFYPLTPQHGDPRLLVAFDLLPHLLIEQDPVDAKVGALVALIRDDVAPPLTTQAAFSVDQAASKSQFCRLVGADRLVPSLDRCVVATAEQVIEEPELIRRPTGQTIVVRVNPAADLLPDVSSMLQLHLSASPNMEPVNNEQPLDEQSARATLCLDSLLAPPFQTKRYIDVPASDLIYAYNQLCCLDWPEPHGFGSLVKWHPATIEHIVSLPTWRDDLWPQVTSLQFYTDGSSMFDVDQSGRRGASAAVLFAWIGDVQYFVGFRTFVLPGEMSAQRAEHAAILGGALWCFHLLRNRSWPPGLGPVEFHFDCLAAGFGAAGFWQQTAHTDLHVLSRSVLHLLQARFGLLVQWYHVPAHQGHSGNEAADAASCLDHAQPHLPAWFWFLERVYQGDAALPLLVGHTFKVPVDPPLESYPVLDPGLTLAPVLPDGTLLSSMDVELCVASANVLTLYPTDSATGAFVSARQESLLKEFSACGTHLVGVQETRSRLSGHQFLDAWHVLSAPATLKGQGGVQLWIASLFKFSGRTFKLAAKHLRIAHMSSRRLLVIVDSPWLKVRILVGHAPCADHLAEVHEWWHHTTQVLGRTPAHLPLIALLDANATLAAFAPPASRATLPMRKMNRAPFFINGSMTTMSSCLRRFQSMLVMRNTPFAILVASWRDWTSLLPTFHSSIMTSVHPCLLLICHCIGMIILPFSLFCRSVYNCANAPVLRRN
eukprot:Skav202839  [mRNA]  locus=scaffold746:111777:115804:+ [translate_table: standard]